MRIEFHKKILKFKNPVGTSRGILQQKTSYIVVVSDHRAMGIGECSILPGLSPDNLDRYEDCLEQIRATPSLYYQDYKDNGLNKLERMPSIRFGLEMAFLDFESLGLFTYFKSDFALGLCSIPINGLIWMGDLQYIYQQIDQKLRDGWNCIKIKIGNNNFQEEIEVIKYIREQYSPRQLQLRLDANGAFNKDDALRYLKQLSPFDIHSIEQPIAQGQWAEMAMLCEQSPIDIALDEELIGVYGDDQIRMLEEIRPAYIICKPSLLGGFKATKDWIKAAESLNIGWWATSALESNIGLNAIAQWTAQNDTTMPQGLGTGGLFSNNLDSPMHITPGHLHFDQTASWGNLQKWIN